MVEKQELDFPNAEHNFSVGDDPVWQRRIGNGQFYLSEIAPIVAMEVVRPVPEGVHDFVAFYGLSNDGIGPGIWEGEKRNWSSAILLQKVGVTLQAEDGTPINVTINEIAPFLKDDPQRKDFADPVQSQLLADKLVGFNTMPFEELAGEAHLAIYRQDPIVQLQKLNEKDWRQIYETNLDAQPV